MKRNHAGVIAIVCRVLMVAFVAAPALTALDLDTAYVMELRRGIAFTMTEKFDSARAVFQSMVDREANDYAARLYLAGVDHAEMLDREDYAGREKFNLDADKAIELAQDALERGGDSAWAYLTIGNAHAYVASLEAKDGSWWTAMRRGLKAKGAYQDALKLKPDFYDVLLGYGTYHYWKSARTEFINWLPFVGDRKDDGIRELELAADSSLFSRELALNSLVWIYIHRGDADLARLAALELKQRFPESRLVTWGLAFSHYAGGRLHEALEFFGEIVVQLETDTTQNYFNLIECRYHRAEIFAAVGDTARVRVECERIVAYSAPESTVKRQGDKIRTARDVLAGKQRFKRN